MEQIADKLGVSTAEILKFGDTVSNFFEQCQNTNVATGSNGNNQTNHYNDQKQLQHQLEKIELELKNARLQTENLQLKLDRSEQELRHWQKQANTL